MSKEYFREPQNYDDQSVDGAHEGYGVSGEVNPRKNHSAVKAADTSLSRSHELFKPIVDQTMNELLNFQVTHESIQLEEIRMETDGIMIYRATNNSPEESLK